MIPKGWTKITLGEFVSLQRGYDLTETQYSPGNVPVIGSSGINGWHDTANVKGPGVTLGRSGASFGVAHYCEVDFWAHNTALFVTDFHGNYEKFAYYVLSHLNFTSYNSGGAQPSLNRNFIYPIEIIIPPLPEQRKITEILSTWDEAIALTEALIAALQTRKQALMQLLLTGQVRFPGFDGAWEEVQLGNCCFVTKLAGYEYTAHFDYSEGGDVVVIRVLNIRSGRLELSDIHTISVEVSEALPRSQLMSGDLVMGYVGSIGDVALIKENGKFHLGPNVAKITPDTRRVKPNFLFQQMQGKRFQDNLLQLATLTSQPALSMTNLRTAKVILPTISEQGEIAPVLETCDLEIDLFRNELTQLQAQKRGLMQQLLTGTVRVRV